MSAGKETRALVLTPAALIPTRRQRWLWENFIPMGTVTAFARRGGEGKSTFSLHVAAQAIRGELPGDLHGKYVDVLVISHEDDWGRVMNPRLIAAGADLNKVWQVAVAWTRDESTTETIPSLPLDLGLLRAALDETGARVVIIDPITSTIDGDLHKLADVRRALDPLVRLAQELDIAVIVIMHFTKGAGRPSDKIAGSHAFRDVIRSALLFATDDETGNRVVTLDKGSYSATAGQSFAFTLKSVDVPTDDGETTNVARVNFLGASDVSVDDIINRGTEAAADDRNAAQSFVLDYLRNRPDLEAAAADVIKAGRAAGFNENEVKLARNRCRNPRIRSMKSAFGAGWVWAIDTEDVTQDVERVGFQNGDAFDILVTRSTADESSAGCCCTHGVTLGARCHHCGGVAVA